MFCPICREEFEPGFSRCADCGATLVESLDSRGPAAPPDPLALSELLISRDLDFLHRLVELLATHHIPAQLASADPDHPEDGTGLLVPDMLWQEAVNIVAPLQPRDLQPSAEPEALPPSLSRPLSDIISLGMTMLPDLTRGVLLGDRESQTRCAYALVRLGEPARTLLMQLLLDAITANDTDGLRRLTRVLAQLPSPGNVPALARLLDDPDRRLNVIAALGYLEDLAAAPHLVMLLEHPETEVRDAAIEALYFLTDETFDFRADDPPDTRTRSVNLWIKWLHQHRLG